MWFIRIGLLLSLAVVSFSHLKIHFPLSTPGFYPVVRIQKPIPNMYELSVCVWVKPYFFPNQDSTVFSYASYHNSNEYNLLICNNWTVMKLCFELVGPTLIFDCPHVILKPGEWYHICNTWSGSNGHMKTYLNGKACFHNNNEVGIISPNKIVRGGGALVLGQEQDTTGYGFDHLQAYYGDIVDFNLWNEVLTEKQIIEAGKCYSRRKKGNVIAGLKTRMTMIYVNISETKLCEHQSEYESFSYDG